MAIANQHIRVRCGKVGTGSNEHDLIGDVVVIHARRTSASVSGSK